MNSKKLTLVFLSSLFILAVVVCDACAGWLIYHKPPFQGKIVDNDTKEPIEGVVVVAVYWNDPWFCFSPGGCEGGIVKVRETLTDKSGEFHFSSYTTLIQPFAVEGELMDFIIYKPGYGGFSGCDYYKYGCIPLNKEKFFSNVIGSKGDVTAKFKQVPVTYGMVELSKLRTKKERLSAIPGNPSPYHRSKELPLLYKAINEENKFFGLGEEE